MQDYKKNREEYQNNFDQDSNSLNDTKTSKIAKGFQALQVAVVGVIAAGIIYSMSEFIHTARDNRDAWTKKAHQLYDRAVRKADVNKDGVTSLREFDDLCAEIDITSPYDMGYTGDDLERKTITDNRGHKLEYIGPRPVKVPDDELRNRVYELEQFIENHQ